MSNIEESTDKTKYERGLISQVIGSTEEKKTSGADDFTIRLSSEEECAALKKIPKVNTELYREDNESLRSITAKFLLEERSLSIPVEIATSIRGFLGMPESRHTSYGTKKIAKAVAKLTEAIKQDPFGEKAEMAKSCVFTAVLDENGFPPNLDPDKIDESIDLLIKVVRTKAKKSLGEAKDL